MNELCVPRELEVPIPPTRSKGLGINLREHPAKFWEILEERDVLGFLPGKGPWAVIYPSSQYISESDAERHGCAHVMLVLKGSSPLPADSVKKEEMGVLVRHLLPLVKEGDCLFGFNHGWCSWRHTSQNWRTFHAHLLLKPSWLGES